jgi:hypothetical protein
MKILSKSETTITYLLKKLNLDFPKTQTTVVNFLESFESNNKSEHHFFKILIGLTDTK